MKIAKEYLKLQFLIVSKVRLLFKHVLYIQMRIKNRLVQRGAKLEVLKNYWNKFLGRLYSRAKLAGDSATSEIIANIVKVPKSVQESVLLEFLKKCQELHAVAFFQWRYRYPNQQNYNEELIVELLNQRIKLLYDQEPPPSLRPCPFTEKFNATYRVDLD